jgi:rhamnose utilization protein RhaD (predicted bifunctional aldolase and dehydrogenase)
VQSPRVIWGLDQPGGPTADVRRLHVIKNNLRAFPEPVGMVVDAEGLVTFGDAPEEPEMASACKDACDWLQRLLVKQPLPAAQVLDEAAQAKIASRTLYRAKAKLRVCSPKVNGVWFWSLPAVEREK